MTASAILDSAETLPGLHRPSSWKRTKDRSPVAMIGTATHGFGRLEVHASSKSAVVMLNALGLADRGHRVFGITNPEQAVLLSAAMSARFAREVAEANPAEADRIRAAMASDALPPCPAVDVIGRTFVFVGSVDHDRWADAAGWRFSAKRQLFYTQDPLQAAGLASQMTPAARAALDASGVAPNLLDALARNPVGRPWLAYDASTRDVVLFSRPDLVPMVTETRLAMPAPGRFTGIGLKEASSLAVLADPILAQALRRISGPAPVVDIDAISIADLMEIVEEDQQGHGGGGKAAKPKPERMTFNRRTRRFSTTAADLASPAGFERAVDGTWSTADAARALALRPVADMDAEMAIQASLARDWTARFAMQSPPPIPTPRGGRAYSPENVAAIQRIVTRDATLVADDMGLGKTVTACGAIDTLRPAHVLIVVMASSIQSWVRHLREWLTYDPDIHVARPGDALKPGVTVVSDTSLARCPDLRTITWPLLVIDEMHRHKNGETGRSRALYHATEGLKALRKVEMSGTPIPNRPQDLFETLHDKMPEVFPSRSTFMKLYGLAQLSDDTEEHAKRRRFLGKLLYHTIMIRRMKSLPVTKTRRTLKVRFDDPALLARLAVETKLYDAFSAERHVTVRARMMADLTAMRRDTAMFKVPFIADLAASYAAEGKAFLIFGHHHQVLEAIKAALDARGLTTILLHGESTTAAERQSAVDKFQQGFGHGIIGGIRSAGTSLTITRACRVIMAELDWSIFDILQAEDRAHRRGQTENVIVDYVVVAGSADALLAANANDKIRIAADITDHFDGLHPVTGIAA